jgi:hypothetical protein
VDALEGLQNLDLGLGTPVNYGRTEHQAVHKVWGTELDGIGLFQAIDLNKRIGDELRPIQGVANKA